MNVWDQWCGLKVVHQVKISKFGKDLEAGGLGETHRILTQLSPLSLSNTVYINILTVASFEIFQNISLKRFQTCRKWLEY